LAIARKEAPASVISLTHNQVRNCPINVATIRSAGSLRLSNCAINASALVVPCSNRRRQMQAYFVLLYQLRNAINV